MSTSPEISGSRLTAPADHRSGYTAKVASTSLVSGDLDFAFLASGIRPFGDMYSLFERYC